MEVLNIILSILLFIIGIGLYKFKLYDYMFKDIEESKNKKERKIKIYSLLSIGLAVLGICTILINDKYQMLSSLYMLIVVMVVCLFISMNKKNNNKEDKRNWNMIISVIVIICVVCLVGYAFKENEIIISNRTVEITGQYGKTFEKEEIKNVELIDEMPKLISRRGGTAIGKINKGKYKLDDGEVTYIYLETKNGPYLKISTDERSYYVNYKDNEKTKEAYNRLEESLN